MGGMIKKWLTGLLLLFVGWLSTAQSVTLQDAVAAYAAGDYNRAVFLFELEINSGSKNPDLYFNLGNAYYELGNPGKALLNYLRAQQIAPRDGELAQQIALIRTQRRDTQGEETDLLTNLALMTVNILRLDELAVGIFLLWAGFFVVGALFIWRNTGRDRLRAIGLGFGFILVLGMLLLFSRLYLENQRPAAVLIENSVVMSGPGEIYLAHFSLSSGAEIRILDRRRGWVRFILPDGRQGWLIQTAVETVQRP